MGRSRALLFFLCAFVAALQTILDEYRKFIAYAPNL